MLDIVVYTVKVQIMFGLYTTKQADRHQRRAASGCGEAPQANPRRIRNDRGW
jgi:hypothetical protein